MHITVKGNIPKKTSIQFWHISSIFLPIIIATVISLIWDPLQLPDHPSKTLGGHILKPDNWLHFIVTTLPVISALPSLFLLIFQRFSPCHSSFWEKTLKRDIAANLFTSLAWLSIPFFWAFVETSAAYIGAVFVLWFIAKCCVVIPRIQRVKSLNRTNSICIVLLAGALLGGMAAWGAQTSSYSDAVKYLLFTHSLVEHHTLDVAKTVENKEFRSFYWGRWHKEFIHKTPKEINAPLFPFFLYLPYAMAGRLGILIFYSLLVSVSIVLTAKSICNFSLARPGTALLSAFAGLTSCPVFFLSHVEYPDIIGLFLFANAFYISSLKRLHPLGKLALITVIAALAYYCKHRLIIGFSGILFAAFYLYIQQFFSNKYYKNIVKITFPVIAFLLLTIVINKTGLWSQYDWFDIISSTLKGLFGGQNFGLFVCAPIFMLAFISLFEVYQKNRAFFLLCFSSISMPLFIFIGMNWFAWHGGFSPPFRYLMFTLPAWTALLTFWLTNSERWRRYLFSALLTWGAIYTFVGLILPHLQTNRPYGPNRLFLFIEEYTHIPFQSFLPSAFMHIGNINLWIFIWLFLSISCIFLIIVVHDSSATSGENVVRKRAMITTFLLLVGIGIIISKPSSPLIVEAENMASHTASIWSPTNPLHMRGRAYRHKSTSTTTVKIPRDGIYLVEVVYVSQKRAALDIIFDTTTKLTIPLTGTATAKTRRIDKKHKYNGLLRGKFEGRQRLSSKQIHLAKGEYNIRITQRGNRGKGNWMLLDYIRFSAVR